MHNPTGCAHWRILVSDSTGSCHTEVHMSWTRLATGVKISLNHLSSFVSVEPGSTSWPSWWSHLRLPLRYPHVFSLLVTLLLCRVSPGSPLTALPGCRQVLLSALPWQQTVAILARVWVFSSELLSRSALGTLGSPCLIQSAAS